ncbi:unnamed protein product [Sphagnum troendelagicum]|uniref:Tetraspanin-10 n=2 Tax=Sphagnum TaxID=13804 RepID=A0ABP0U540_9BRYO|nr:hypothetical protein BDL97_19G043100 [Sphagnum fallax]KAH8931860.1 hypothetical protein BDL97_19G043100 [Sphagnum fallax]
MDSMYPKISTEPPSRSALFIKLINVLGLLLSLGIIGLGIWLATQHGDCEKPLTIIVFVIGIIFLIVSILGLVGASFAMVPILYTYLVLMLIVLVVLAGFIIFVFVVTAQGGGYSVPGQQFQEYTLHDYSPYIRHRLNNPTNWEHVRRCIETSNNCEKLNSIQSAADYYNADLNPIQSGCCRPPTECDYTIVNAGDFDTSTGSNSSNPDCLTYSNDPSIKCYDCQSCKGGVAQEIKRDGRILGIVIIVVFFLLVLVYSVGCFAGRAASREHYSRV